MGDLFVPANDARFGALNVPPYWILPRLPNIVSEFAAIIPLASHLASFRHDYQIAGEISLAGRLMINLFPKLGVLASLSRLCKCGPEFLDEASVRGSSSTTVRDVQWGSVFPCANGAASKLIAGYALARRTNSVIRMPETLPSKESFGNSEKSFKLMKKRISTENESSHRRYQTLHVLHFGRTKRQLSWKTAFMKIMSSQLFEWIGFTLSCGICVLLCLCGLYGTAVALLCGSASQVARRFVTVQRPPGYLENNESHSACMLVGAHNNANIWYLYTGDRGVVDSLLNKTMIVIPTTTSSKMVAVFLRIFHIIQIITMTYVAAQKGWDGVAMVLLMVASRMMQLRFTEKRLAEYWLESNSIAVDATSFEYTGRTMMIGAVQAFSGSKRTLWIDDIVAPHPRRQAWLEKLDVVDLNQGSAAKESTFSDLDQKMIDVTAGMAKLGAEIMKKETRHLVKGAEVDG